MQQRRYLIEWLLWKTDERDEMPRMWSKYQLTGSVSRSRADLCENWNLVKWRTEWARTASHLYLVHIHCVITLCNAVDYEYQVRATIKLNTRRRTALSRWNVHRLDQSIPQINLPQARQRIFHKGGFNQSSAPIPAFDDGLKPVRLVCLYQLG